MRIDCYRKIVMSLVLIVSTVFTGLQAQASGCGGSYYYYLEFIKVEDRGGYSFQNNEFKVRPKGSAEIAVKLKNAGNEFTMSLVSTQVVEGMVTQETVNLKKQNITFAEFDGCDSDIITETGRYTMIIPELVQTIFGTKTILKKYEWPIIMQYYDELDPLPAYEVEDLLPLF